MKLHNCFIKCRKHPLLTGPLDMLLFTINKVCTLHQLGRWTWTPVSRDNSGLCSLGLMSCPLIKYECVLWEVINLTFVHTSGSSRTVGQGQGTLDSVFSELLVLHPGKFSASVIAEYGSYKHIVCMISLTSELYIDVCKKHCWKCTSDSLWVTLVTF
jgi:hypothetical protein